MQIFDQNTDAGKKILVIEENSIQSEYLKVLLENNNYKVFCSLSGKEALASLENLTPDMVISNFRLPDTLGFELCRQIKEKTKPGIIPLLLVVSRTDLCAASFETTSVACNYYIKPIDAKSFLSTVRQILSHHRSDDSEKCRLQRTQCNGQKDFFELKFGLKI
jgi:DNA-binding response OmpR family regulator